MVPAGFQSALIESLRGASSAGSVNPGLSFFANPAAPGAPVVKAPRARGPQAFDFPVLTMPAVQPPTPPAPGEDLAPLPPVRDIDPLPPIDDIVVPEVPESDPVVPSLPDVPDVPDAPDLEPLPEDDIPPLPEDVVLPEVDPIPALPDVPPEPPAADDKPDALTPLPDPIVVDDKPPKKDASGWGEGGEDLVRDPEVTPTPVVPDPLPEEEIPLLPEDVPLPQVPVIPEIPVMPPAPEPVAPDVVPEPVPTDERPDALVPIPDSIEVKPPKRDASGWGEGGDNLVRDDSVIVPSLPDPVPVAPETLPELPVEDIPLLPEDVDLPEVLPIPDLPAPQEEEAPVEVVTAPPVRYMPETAPVMAPLEQAPVDRATPTPSPEPLPEDVDLPEVETVPEVIVPSLPDPVPAPPEDLAPIDDPIELLPEDVDLPEVMPIPEIRGPGDSQNTLPLDLSPIDLLPEEIDLPTVDDLPELDGNEAALTELYADVFNRAPDQGGFDFWLWAMNDLGYTPEMVRAEFLRSPEYQDLQAQQRDRRLLEESAFVG